LPIREDIEKDTAVDKPEHVVTGSFDIGQVWFSREVVTRMSRVIIVQLLSQFFPLEDFQMKRNRMKGNRGKRRKPEDFLPFASNNFRFLN
jgi:hypothetical protein